MPLPDKLKFKTPGFSIRRAARPYRWSFALIIAFFATAAAVSGAENTTSPTELAQKIVGAFDALFRGPYAGARAIHTKGILLSGTFTPTFDAGLLSRAEHFSQGTIPVFVRFSNFSGLPTVADSDQTASPRGMSIKFMLPQGDTDIVSHSYNGFPVATPEDFLEFLRALASPEPSVIAKFLATHPSAKAFAEAPKPPPQSYATEEYFGVNAFRFTNTAGISHYGRYRIEPVAGTRYLGKTEIGARTANYLAYEMSGRLGRAPVEFRLMIQLADPDDNVSDGSVAWPRHRPSINAGTLSLTSFSADEGPDKQKLLFTPLNLVGGITPSADPLIISRNRAYRVSYERRTKAVDSHPKDNGAKNALLPIR